MIIKNDLKVGDLVYVPSETGLYIENTTGLSSPTYSFYNYVRTKKPTVGIIVDLSRATIAGVMLNGKKVYIDYGKIFKTKGEYNVG